MSLSQPFRIGAALTTLVSLWVMKDKVKYQDFAARESMTDQWVINKQYGVTQGDNYQTGSGYARLEKGASWWRRHKAFGFFHLKVHLKRLENRINQFIGVINQPLGWLAGGSFLLSHPKAYKVFTEPVKLLGEAGLGIGKAIKSLFYTAGTGGAPGAWKPWIGRVTKAARTANWGKFFGWATLPLVAAAFIFKRGQRVYSGQESQDTFRPADPIGDIQHYLP